MAKELEEAVEQQSFNLSDSGETARKVYYVTGALSPYDALQTTGLPAIGDLYTDTDQPAVTFVPRVTKITCSNIDKTDDKHKIVVDYEFNREKSTNRPSAPSNGDEVYTYEPSGETAKILTVPSDLAQTVYPTGKSAEVGQYIGKNSDGTIEGVDILDNSEVLTVTQWKDPANYTTTFQDGVRAIYNTVNSVSWYGAAAGEALFTGMRQVSVNETMVELEFTFMISRNRSSAELPIFKDKDDTTITVSGGKDGWQYLWTQTREKKKDPKGVYTNIVAVSDVYETNSFSALGLTGVR
jgi:hypothetical protein